MRRLLALLLLAAPLANAGDLDRAVTATLYWERPLGATTNRDAAPAFGFRVEHTRTVQTGGLSMLVQRMPLVDARFSQSGFDSLALRGIVMRQSAAGTSAGETVSPWLIGGIVAGSILLIANEERKGRAGNTPATKGGGI